MNDRLDKSEIFFKGRKTQNKEEKKGEQGYKL